MEPNLHGLCPLNCQDLLSWLPSNLAFFILSFLDPGNLLCYWDTFCFNCCLNRLQCCLYQVLTCNFL
ncbi:hypothetical protein GBAR_LOCUS28160 [Geodia barretti]|uniref:Uncharacterized protein n=1 Tax=Geodia barretti TaxID=519541 RepID=A0AA35XBK5_GEOBA|nr:hypothetical protein GBAR_LOCUS28160 [Geodia barretti]